VPAIDSEQTKAVGLQERLFQRVLRTADYLLWGELEILRLVDMTLPQYNVLRILRGARPDGLSCRQISDRMVTRDSDMTRLVDNLKRRRFVARARHHADRRAVLVRITDSGLRLLRELDQPVDNVHREQLKQMEPAQLQQLIDLLDLVRQPAREHGRSGMPRDE
jgi:DNA-binding MarR family transcriptional regulator